MDSRRWPERRYAAHDYMSGQFATQIWVCSCDQNTPFPQLFTDAITTRNIQNINRM
jgi:hypothetical protein